MGEVYYGIHEEIAEMLTKRNNLKTFVETGTWHGDSAKWASSRFDSVYTIEIIEEFYIGNDFSEHSNICAYLGDSRKIFKLLVPELVQAPSLFWLDAHWTGHQDYREEYGKCAVVEEIEAINRYSTKHAIMVDDVRLFPSLMRVEPSEVIDLLSNEGARKVTIKDDVFYAEPKGD